MLRQPVRKEVEHNNIRYEFNNGELVAQTKGAFGHAYLFINQVANEGICIADSKTAYDLAMVLLKLAKQLP